MPRRAPQSRADGSAPKRQNSTGAIENDQTYDGTDNQIGVVGASPENQGTGSDYTDIDHHVIISSTLLTLFVLPELYALLLRKQASR